VLNAAGCIMPTGASRLKATSDDQTAR